MVDKVTCVQVNVIGRMVMRPYDERSGEGE